MKSNLALKTVLIIGTLLVFLYGIFGIPQGLSGKALTTAMTQRINLGLDLKGGTHLILQVMVNEAVNAEGDRLIERLREELQAANVTYTDVSKPDEKRPEQVRISGVPPEQSADVRRIVQDNFPEYDLTSGAENTWMVTMRPEPLSQLKQKAVAQAIETIRGRIDQLGVTEPVIQEHGLGDYQILVQLPGVDDPARVKDIMQSTAMLELRRGFGGPYATEQEAYQARTTQGQDAVVVKGKPEAGQRGDAWYLVSRTSVVSGRDLRDARPIRDEGNRPAVGFSLTREGGERFGNWTGQNIGNLLAVVLDNRVHSMATIQDRITDEGRITGVFSEQQTQDLAMVLRSGALPASIRYLEERTVGPSLGADSIRQGVLAALVGLIVVMALMLVYYKGAGINANLGLLLNLVILLGFLGFSGASLTLPGIAGVILTIGMGVDSNVLIFERIREELRAGKTPASAVDQGFARAWLTIIDTHVTTIVSAFILFIFGTGPVRGFAVTLTFGLLANLFTAVFVSRVIFDAILNRKRRGEALSI